MARVFPLRGIGHRQEGAAACAGEIQGVPVPGQKNHDMERGLIYSKRYPPLDLFLTGALVKETEWPEDEMEASLNRMYTSIKKFWARYQDESSFILKEERVQPAKEFVQRVEDFCDLHEIDVDIWQENFFVSAELYLSTCVYNRQFTTQFAQLMNLSDRMSMWRCQDGPGEFLMKLEFDTHDFYVNGRPISDIF